MDRRRFLAGAAIGGLGLALGACATTGRAGSPAPLTPADFSVALSGIEGAEGAATTPDGRLFISNGKGAIGVLEADGTLRQVGTALSPTGVAIDPQGRAIVANMGLLHAVPGPLQRVDTVTGIVETLVAELDGRQLVASNSPAVARDGTIYCSHSTWSAVKNIGKTNPDGFIYRVGADGAASVAATGLRGVNGLALDAGDRHLYAALTPEGRIRRWRRTADGTLGEGEYFGPVLGNVVPDHMIGDIVKLPPEARAGLGYCDGIAFDADGNLWITMPFANRIVALTPAGRLVDIVHDPAGAAIKVPTNLSWGGSDLRDLYVVSRGSGTIVKARTSVAGLPMANWPA